MSTPIIEYIAENIKDAINAITVANNFNQTLTAIRPKRNDFKDVSPDDLTALVWQLDADAIEGMIGTATWHQSFVIEVIVLDGDKATASIDTRINQVRADIEKKLMEDVTRGEYAYDTSMVAAVKFGDGKGFSGIAVEAIVKYRTKIEDPYTKA